MYQFILIIHIVVCVALVISVLLQTGKGSALSMFGGGGGDTLFSATSGASFMKKFTTTVAITFAVTSLLLALFTTRTGMRSVTQQYPIQQSAPQPEPPAGPEAETQDKGAVPDRNGATEKPAPSESKTGE